MAELPTKKQIAVGDYVFIESKQDQGTGKLTKGIVKEILTSGETHPYGIMVEIETGEKGRVKKLGSSTKSVNENSIYDSIPKDEDAWNEFKSSFRADFQRFSKGDGKLVHNKDVEKEISVTISAMANKEGGTLFIGIDDDGKILGLEQDCKLLKNPNNDKLQRTIWQSIQNYIGNMAYASKLDLSLIEQNSKKICVIKIPPSDEPIFIHDNHTQESYVRIGPKSEKFSPAEFMKYCKTRFSD